MLQVEARPAEFDDLGFKYDIVAELGGLEKTRPRVHHRIAFELVVPRELVLAHAERLREQRGGAAIEHREVAREEHDPRRVAVAPFDARVSRVDHHRFVPSMILSENRFTLFGIMLIVAPYGARHRGGSLRR